MMVHIRTRRAGVLGFAITGGGGPASDQAEEDTWKFVFASETIEQGSDLTIGHSNLASYGNREQGYWFGGRVGLGGAEDGCCKQTWADEVSVNVNSMDEGRISAAGCGNATRGISAGGNFINIIQQNTEKRTYASDDVVAGGNLTQAKTGPQGAGNAEVGLIAGGNTTGGSFVTNINEYDYASDTASNAASMAEAGHTNSATGFASSTHAYFGGGRITGNVRTDTVEKVRFSDYNVTSDITLPIPIDVHSQQGNPSFGVTIGGSQAPNNAVLQCYKLRFADDFVDAPVAALMANTLWTSSGNSSNPGSF